MFSGNINCTVLRQHWLQNCGVDTLGRGTPWDVNNRHQSDFLQSLQYNQLLQQWLYCIAATLIALYCISATMIAELWCGRVGTWDAVGRRKYTPIWLPTIPSMQSIVATLIVLYCCNINCIVLWQQWLLNCGVDALGRGTPWDVENTHQSDFQQSLQYNQLLQQWLYCIAATLIALQAIQAIVATMIILQ